MAISSAKIWNKSLTLIFVCMFKFFHYHFALIDTISFPILSAYLLASY